MKICLGCTKEKDFSEFTKMVRGKDGYMNFCKVCRVNKERDRQNRIKGAQSYIEREAKTCPSCETKKLIHEFAVARNQKDGHAAICKTCCIIFEKQRREKRKIFGSTIIRDRKTCWDCKVEKSITLFSIENTSADGHKSKCKKCDCENIFRKIRSHVYHSINRLSENGKRKHTIQYGINIKAIVESLGTRPSNHHLDHIIPLSAFDYTQDWQIAASWHPKNLQWLSGPDNLRKSDNYKKEDLTEYLSWFKEQIL